MDIPLAGTGKDRSLHHHSGDQGRLKNARTINVILYLNRHYIHLEPVPALPPAPSSPHLRLQPYWQLLHFISVVTSCHISYHHASAPSIDLSTSASCKETSEPRHINIQAPRLNQSSREKRYSCSVRLVPPCSTPAIESHQLGKDIER